MYTRLYVLVQKNKDLLGENKIIGIFELFEGEMKVKELNSLYSENKSTKDVSYGNIS